MTTAATTTDTAATDEVTIRVFCQCKERAAAFEARVVPDLSVNELVAGLNEEDYLPALAAGDRWRVVHERSGTELTPNAKLDEAGVKDGDQIDFLRDSNGAEA